MKSLTQSLKKPKASIAINILLKRANGYEKELHDFIVSDIRYRIRERLTTGDALAKETGIQRTTISHVVNRRRKFTQEQIKIYIWWLQEKGF